MPEVTPLSGPTIAHLRPHPAVPPPRHPGRQQPHGPPHQWCQVLAGHQTFPWQKKFNRWSTTNIVISRHVKFHTTLYSTLFTSHMTTYRIGKENEVFSWMTTEIQNSRSWRHSSPRPTAPLAVLPRDLSVTVQADAKKHGLGAWLLKNSKPIAFASKSLTDAETK